MSTNDAGHSITVAEAAARLGVSERTIRRRIKEGELRAASIKTPQGHTWHVDPASLPDHPALPPGTPERHPAAAARHSGQDEIATRQDPVTIRQAGDATRQPPDMSPGTPDTPELMKALEMIDERQATIDQLQTKLLEASNAAAHWQARAVAAEQTVQRLLPAPKDEPELPAAPERRSWWRRLLG